MPGILIHALKAIINTLSLPDHFHFYLRKNFFMIKSMTGFGRAVGDLNGSRINVEIKSLNSKFIEIQTRIPLTLRDREMDLRQLLTREIERGKVDVTITIEQNGDETTSLFNSAVIKSYISALKKIEQEAQIAPTDYLRVILSNPNITAMGNGGTDDSMWQQVETLVKDALKNFNSYRLSEGLSLEKEFTERLTDIENHLKQLEKHEAERLLTIKQRIRAGLEQVADELQLDKNRFEQELIYYIEKLDISEEKQRLRNHCNYFTETINQTDCNGKKLGFIIQEIGREINTLGSKANHAGIQRHVVEMKDALEKMKEQIANVL